MCLWVAFRLEKSHKFQVALLPSYSFQTNLSLEWIITSPLVSSEHKTGTSTVQCLLLTIYIPHIQGENISISMWLTFSFVSWCQGSVWCRWQTVRGVLSIVLSEDVVLKARGQTVGLTQECDGGVTQLPRPEQALPFWYSLVPLCPLGWGVGFRGHDSSLPLGEHQGNSLALPGCRVFSCNTPLQAGEGRERLPMCSFCAQTCYNLALEVCHK